MSSTPGYIGLLAGGLGVGRVWSGSSNGGDGGQTGDDDDDVGAREKPGDNFGAWSGAGGGDVAGGGGDGA